MSLLDDVSIVVTPNGYKAGELYAVIPSDGAADMDVTRATAATRVDENGLVNYAEVLGSEEIDCGNFECATPSTYWNEVGNSSLVVGDYQGRTNVANINILGTANSDRIKQDFYYVDGVTYLISLDIYLVSGDFRCDTSNSVVPYDFVATNITGSWQTLTGYFTAISTGTDGLWLRSSQQINQFYISNISVKEVTRANVPRIDYTGGGCPHILAEPMRTNLIPYSEDFSQWGTQDKIILTPNSVSSPSGDVNAYKIIPTSTSGVHKVRENLSTVSGDYTFSIFAKQGEYKNILLWDDILSGGLGVNLDDLSIFRNQNNQSYNIEDYGSGWVRISVTLSYSSQQILPSLYIYDNSATPKISFAGNDIDGLYIWGSQTEQGSYATSYIPNFGTALGVTRNQDILTRDGIGSLINDSEGVLFVELSALANDATSRRISLSDGSISNRVSLELDETANKIKAFITLSGTTQTLEYTATNLLQFNKIAIKYKINDFAIWFNGTEVATASSGDVPTGMNQLSFTAGSTSHNFDGKVKQLQVYTTALGGSPYNATLSDARLAALTSL